MKKLLAMLMAVALCATGFALAEEAEALEINSLIEDGEFVIQVDAKGDLGWIADDMAQDPSVVKLACADTLEDTFVARYTPVGDGDVTVGVRHFTGIACDQAITWDLHVENGAVQDVTGGSNTASPEDAFYDPCLIGAWLQQEVQFTTLSIEKNPARGWDVEIISPMSHSAYVFKTTVQYDCELDGFVYDKGKYWDIDGNFDGTAALGEARTAGTTGIFTFEGDEAHPALSWYNSEHPDETLLFERADAISAVPDSEAVQGD